jgi:hypothetical protein
LICRSDVFAYNAKMYVLYRVECVAVYSVIDCLDVGFVLVELAQ